MIGKAIKRLVITCNSSLYGSKDYNRHQDLVSFKSQHDTLFAIMSDSIRNVKNLEKVGEKRNLES